MRTNVIIIGLLCVLLLPSCKRQRFDGYKITDIVMQRVEIEDMPAQDSYLYFVYIETNAIMKEVSFLNQSANNHDFVDSIDAVIVEDSAGNNIDEWLVPMNTYKGEKYNRMCLYAVGDRSHCKYVSWYDGNIHDWLQKRKDWDGGIELFSISRNAPVPEYIKIQFPDRVIRTKVINEAKCYKISALWFER